MQQTKCSRFSKLKSGKLTLLLLALGLLGCDLFNQGDADDASALFLNQEQLMDPTSCKGCHTSHYNEWAASMHAYASKDPVFLAMNRRGQRETNGELGSFCVQCHAPMALRMGATTDGLNLHELPEKLQGVTCYFCHSVDGVTDTHNNPLTLSSDATLRGGLKDPFPNTAHASSYSSFHDRTQPESAALCGSCHDVVTHNGHHLERTFLEWQQSIYGQPDLNSFLSCGDCHMSGRTEPAANIANSPVRRRHNHLMPAVDVALTPFPDHINHVAAVQEELDYTIEAHLCVDENETVSVRMGNIGAGHSFPSGAAHDRRLWVEIQAFRNGEEVWSYGIVPEGVPLASIASTDLLSFYDHIFDHSGEEALMFWNAASNESFTLEAPGLAELEAAEQDKHRVREFNLAGLNVDKIQMKAKLRPMALHVLQSLIDSGDLDPSVKEAVPTFTLKSTEITWTSADGVVCLPY